MACVEKQNSDEKFTVSGQYPEYIILNGSKDDSTLKILIYKETSQFAHHGLILKVSTMNEMVGFPLNGENRKEWEEKVEEFANKYIHCQEIWMGK